MRTGVAESRHEQSLPDGPALTRDVVRNVVLLGAGGAGKTTLVRSLAGDDLQNLPDGLPELALTCVHHGEAKLNLLDPPGSPELAADIRAGLRAADAALFVVSAVHGLDAATRMLWEECAAEGLPRALAITHLDSPRADFDETVAICRRYLGGETYSDDGASGASTGIVPWALPLADDDGGVGGLIELPSRRVWDCTGGGRTPVVAAPEHLRGIESPRGELVEALVADTEDESLVAAYLSGGEVDSVALAAAAADATRRGTLFPVLPVSVLPVSGLPVLGVQGVGVRELLDLIVEAFPAPGAGEPPLVTTVTGEPVDPPVSDPAGPLLGEVVRTIGARRSAERAAVVRVLSGTLRPGAVRAAGTFGPPDVRDAEMRADSPVLAGDIAEVAATGMRTGDTLSATGSELRLPAWLMPEPQAAVILTALDDTPADQLAAAVADLGVDDPALRLGTEETPGDSPGVVLMCQGRTHADVAVKRLAARHGVLAVARSRALPLLQTFATPAQGSGADAAAPGVVCTVDVQPLGPGAGLEFAAGALPRAAAAAVETAVRDRMARGVGGHPLTDLRVTVVEATPAADAEAYAAATALALTAAAHEAGLRLLEPVDEVMITVADEFVRHVTDDLAGRRGRVLAGEPQTAGRTRLRALVPQVQLARYAVELHALTHGTGSCTRRYAGHLPAPSTRRRAWGAS